MKNLNKIFKLTRVTPTYQSVIFSYDWDLNIEDVVMINGLKIEVERINVIEEDNGEISVIYEGRVL